MKLWLDTEFNGFGGELISMALVDEADREWYEVLGSVTPCAWVASNVIPVLKKRKVRLSTLQLSLQRWLRHYDTVHIIANWPEDIAHFCRVLITGPGCQLVTPPLTFEVVDLHHIQPDIPHNALSDARALRTAQLQAAKMRFTV